MIEERECYVKDIPLGSIILEDTYTVTGALLLLKQTVISESIVNRLFSYKGKIRVKFNVPDVEEFDIIADKDDSVTFDNSFKEYALDSISTIYDNLDRPDVITEGVIRLSDSVCSLISSSKALEINLANLKVSDEYTYKHSVDVGTIASIIAARLDKSEQFIKDITIAGVLHDMGKSKVPDDILNKPGKLTTDEFSIMKKHPLYGYQLLLNCDMSDDIRSGVLNHHENVDGSGYPRGLLSADIGDMAKILTIADVFDALVTKRPYKPARTASQTIETMFTMSNKFDIDYFRIFLATVNAYPNGTLVSLSNGEVCKVLKQNPSFPLRPIVCTLDNKVIDLSRDLNYLSVVISN